MKSRLIPGSLSLLILFAACQKDNFQTQIQFPDLPETPFDYSPKWNGLHGHMEGDDLGITDAGATLGRVLFYDKILSINNTVSCGSCHHQSIGFADGEQFSAGIQHQVTDRNAPPISNLYDDNLLFWDGRSTELADLALRPIRNHKEMGMEDMEFLVQKINAAPYYGPLFEDAYGTTEVNANRIADALSQFIKSMIGCDSPIDRATVSGQPLSPQAEMGRNIFFGKGQCYQCHSGPDFNDRGGFFFIDLPPNAIQFGWAQDIADIGLDEHYEDVGFGVFDPSLVGVFKIPSLRNVALTAPYMHDGRFATLEDVINHYNSGIQRSPNLDQVLRSWDTGDAITLDLTEVEKSALVAFLHSLTDESYMHDARFADPFIN